MHQPEVVSAGDPVARLPSPAHRVCDVEPERLGGDPILHRAMTRDVGHQHSNAEVSEGVADGEDVVITQSAEDLRLCPRAKRGQRGWVQDLDGHLVASGVIDRLVDLALPAMPETPDNLVAVRDHVAGWVHDREVTVLFVGVIGLAVAMQGDSKATVYGIVLAGGSGSPGVIDKFEITNDDADLATRLYDMAESVRTRVDSLGPEVVVIRRADFAQMPRRGDAPKIRLLAEGALASAARSRCEETFLATGKDLGTWCGTDKATVESEAKSLLKATKIAQKYAVAAAAALGALTHP